MGRVHLAMPRRNPEGQTRAASPTAETRRPSLVSWRLLEHSGFLATTGLDPPGGRGGLKVQGSRQVHRGEHLGVRRGEGSALGTSAVMESNLKEQRGQTGLVGRVPAHPVQADGQQEGEPGGGLHVSKLGAGTES